MTVSIPTRSLGSRRLKVSALGLGCMTMTDVYGPGAGASAVATIDRALEVGVFFLDTADTYADGANERLVGRALTGRRDRVCLATKFGFVFPDGGGHLNGRPEYVKAACEASLRRLGTDHIDLYYLHRVDPEVPVEETVGAMARLVAEGKVLHLGLSEVDAGTLRRANAVHPISALETEWSLWTRDIEAEILPAARELGVGIVPYSPLGRGFLTGQITSLADLAPDDWRRSNPRFSGENFDRNLRLVEAVRAIAAEKGVTPGQLALAWLLAQGDDVVPIPGTKRRSRLEENAAAAAVSLTQEEQARIDALAPLGVAAGDRYPNMEDLFGL
jgi:aryl-alcohol dehydrogenase-like predicted oxidoreductase